MKVKNHFFSTLIGLFPMVFILCAIGSGIEKIIEQNNLKDFDKAKILPLSKNLKENI